MITGTIGNLGAVGEILNRIVITPILAVGPYFVARRIYQGEAFHFDQFWLGTKSGSSVDGLYNNWGNEPDNYGSGQDALGLALTYWPYGLAGQWNDISQSNSLYFVVELE